MKKKRLLDAAYIAMGAALIAVCAWISIPAAVPFTMQTFAVFCVAGLLGWKRGTLSVAVYIALGAVGLPVFSGFGAGIGMLVGVTGGYIIGFLFTSLIVGFVADRFGGKLWALTLADVLGLAVCYAFGTVWFMLVYAKNTGSIGLSTALLWCVVPYLIPDALKILLSSVLVGRLRKHVK